MASITLIRCAVGLAEMVLAPLLISGALLARCLQRPVDIGLGPEPLINNVHHKAALLRRGFSAETYVHSVYHVTQEFDIRADLAFKGIFRILRPYYLFFIAIMRYRCLYVYFNGGPLGFTQWLWRIEPFLYRMANMKVVVMPYGSDVQEMSRSGNLLFKEAMSRDYPMHRFRRRKVARKVDLWTRGATHVISGCDWVDYMYHWDTLMLAHFSVDTDVWKPLEETSSSSNATGGGPLRILHAPNHRCIKGTAFFVEAVSELNEEGVDVELVILEKVPNAKIREVMASVDVVADQLIIGWYAMLALEAMAMEKPVLCYIRNDLETFYTEARLLSPGELPILKCSPQTVKEVIRKLAERREDLENVGRRSREYVKRHHSLAYIGGVFDGINRSAGIDPREGKVSDK